MSNSYCVEAELDGLRSENEALKRELVRANGELIKARSDVNELKDVIVKLVVRCVQ